MTEYREKVAETYAKASNAAPGTDAVEPKSVVAQLAGYTDDDFAMAPPDAVINAFGCGNPLSFMEVKEGETIVDFGSGAGLDLILGAKRVGPTGKVIGVDMTDDMLEKARQNVAAAGMAEIVELKKGVIEEMPVEAGTADWVMSNCVINSSPEKTRIFSEIARVLKPGGRFLISDLVIESVPSCMMPGDSLLAKAISHSINEADYVKGLEEAGLVNVEVKARLKYDESQIMAFFKSSEFSMEGMCCGPGETAPWMEPMAGFLEGKVWSAKFYGQKA